VLVCMAISLEKRLQSVTNYFLLSLAVTDLLVSVIVMPFSIINEFTGRWLFGSIVCNMYVTADVFMCTSSILHLCTISLERYMAIRAPLSTRNKSRTVVILKVILVWVTAMAISSPITILGMIDDKNIIAQGQCIINNDYFKLYGSLCAFFIPLFVMIFSYSLTLFILIRRSKKCHSRKKESGQPQIRRSLSRKTGLKKVTRVHFHAKRPNKYPAETPNEVYTAMIPRKSRLKPQVTSLSEGDLSSSPPVIPRGKVYNFNNRLSSPNDCYREIKRETTRFQGDNDQTLTGSRSLPKQNGVSVSHDQAHSHLSGLVRKHQLVIKAANILLMRKTSPVSPKKDDVTTEQKASKVIGIVFMIFVVCWAPFFIMNVIPGMCKQCYLNPTLMTAFVWLGYVSSTLNPIIYTMFNKTFKITMKKLIMCQYDKLQRHRPVKSNWLMSNDGGGSIYNKSSSNNSLGPDIAC
ncbi:hypothetical protein FSP39_014976, partial [Pinctada imbricata]